MIRERQIDARDPAAWDRPEVKRRVEWVLYRLLTEVERYLQARNRRGDGWLERLQGSLRQTLQDFFIDFDALRAEVPHYAEQLLRELDRPETRAIKEELRAIVSQVRRQHLDPDRSQSPAGGARAVRLPR